MKMTTKQLCIQGLLIALVTIGTMLFQIPVSATQGYIHLGDSMILLAAVFFGARYGAIAGGFGSALADILTGYSHWAPFTFLIKGIMGYLVGRLVAHGEEKFIGVRNIGATVLGIAWMVFGYYISGGILHGSFGVALTSIPENIIQGIAGTVIFFVVGTAFHKAGVAKLLSQE